MDLRAFSVPLAHSDTQSDQTLIREAWAGARESAFLTHSQVTLTLPSALSGSKY